MKVYIDLVILLNIMFDYLLLTTTSYILKRNVSFKKILLGSLVGGISILFLFVRLNNFTLFLFKVIVSVLMILSTFGYKKFKYFLNNIIYLYLSSIVLGGALYLINNEFNYKNYGLLFSTNKFSLNIVILILITPIILFMYYKETRKLKLEFQNKYRVDMYYKNKRYRFNAFLDTGNKLKDPYKKRPIILIHSDKIKSSYEDSILVPYKTVSGNGILKCIIVDKIVIDNNHVITNPLIGLSNEKFNIESVNMILNSETIEGGIK